MLQNFLEVDEAENHLQNQDPFLALKNAELCAESIYPQIVSQLVHKVPCSETAPTQITCLVNYFKKYEQQPKRRMFAISG
jgi:hypothetical protein